MSPLESYTPEICEQLRQLAKNRRWLQWSPSKVQRDLSKNAPVKEDLLEEVELTYHLHHAAEASGARAGMPPMSAFPLRFRRPGTAPSGAPAPPAMFILNYVRRHPSGQIERIG